MALEPLRTNSDLSALKAALGEFKAAVKAKTLAFVGIYSAFMDDLSKIGFQGLCVGKDPWVRLADGEPTGKKAKGIRTARNHAIKCKVTIEEWKLDALSPGSSRRDQIEKIFSAWTESGFLQMDGFMLSTNPFLAIEGRRLFVARHENQTVGFLMVMPVVPGKKYYFEDLMFLPSAPNGATELLMLTAMATLRAENASEVSLGVVSMNDLRFHSAEQNHRRSNRWILKGLTHFAHAFYNSEGIELHRKRFQPHLWENIYIACADERASQSIFTWVKILFAALELFKPKFKISLNRVASVLNKFFRRNRAVVLWILCFGPLIFVNTRTMIPAVIVVFATALVVRHIYRTIRGAAFFWTMLLGWILTVPLFPTPPAAAVFPHLYRPALFVAGLFFSEVLRTRLRASITFTFLIIVVLFSVVKPAMPLGPLLVPVALFGAGYLAGKVNFQVYRWQSARHSRDKSVGKTIRSPSQVEASSNR